jgi:transcriptional/translational regulatory protein YebC/TACO1
MAGHSQWNNIKFRKAKQDAQKSKVFTKFSKEIYLYAKSDSNPNTNPSLKNIISQARASEVPTHIIEKAIKKACEKEQEGFECTYECIQGNNAFIVRAITNNKARTAAEVKEILRDHSARIGKCQYLFDQVYLIKTPVHDLNEEVLSLCQRIEEQEKSYYLFFNQENASEVYSILKNVLIFAKPIFIPYSIVESNDEGECLLNALEELQDVYQVFSNLYFFS